MFQSIARTLAVSSVLACLAGCGLNAVRVDSAGDVAKFAKAVSEQAPAVFKDIEARREKAFVTMIASDENCEPVQPLMILVPNGPPVPNSVPPPLCPKAGEPLPAGYEAVEFDFSPYASETIQPTLDLAASVAAYGEAMAKIAASPKIDTAKQIDAVLEFAAKAKATAESFGIDAIPEIKALSDEQKSTAAKLINLVRELAREQQHAQAIGALYAAKSREIDALLPELTQQIEMWITVAGVGADQMTTLNLERAYRSERGKLSLEGRTAMITLIREAQLQPARTEKTAKSFKQAVDKLAAENQHLGELLTNPSAEDRQKAAEISQDRLLEAIGQIAKALAAWKVI